MEESRASQQRSLTVAQNEALVKGRTLYITYTLC